MHRRLERGPGAGITGVVIALLVLPMACARPPVVVDETFSPAWELSGTAPTTRAAPLQRNRTQLTRGTIGDDLFPSLSADSKTLFFATSRFSPGFDIVARDLHGHLLTSVTSGEWNDIQPQPSPVNSQLAFASDREGSWDIYLTDTVALEKTERLVDSEKDTLGPRWSPDGKSIVCFRRGKLHAAWEIWLIDIDDRQQRFLAEGLFPDWSPDGKWIVFQRATRNGEGWFSIWKIRVDGTQSIHLLASWSDTWGAVHPVWSPDGEWIAFTAVGKDYRPMTPTIGHLEQADLYVVAADGGQLLEVSADRPGISEWNLCFARDWHLYFSSDQGGQVRIWSMETRFSAARSSERGRRSWEHRHPERTANPNFSPRSAPRVPGFCRKPLHFRRNGSDIRNNDWSPWQERRMEVQLDSVVPSAATLPDAPEPTSDEAKLLVFVSEARRLLLEEGWMTGAVVVDGQILTVEREREFSERTCADFDTLRIQVQELPTFLVEMFEECQSSVPKLLDLKDRITQDIRAGNEVAASELLLPFMTDLHVVLSAYHNGRMLLRRVVDAGEANESGVRSERDTGDDNDPMVVDRFARLKDTLTDVQDGFGRKDFVMVSDALEFEVPELLNSLASDLQESVSRLRTLQGE